MEIRVAVADAQRARGLVQRLAGELDPTSVLLDGDNRDAAERSRAAVVGDRTGHDRWWVR